MKNTWGGKRDNRKKKPDDKRGGVRVPGPGKTLGRPRKDENMIVSTHGIWYDQPSDDALSYEVTDPVTGDVKLIYVEPGAYSALPGTLLDVHLQDQADAILDELFPE